MTGHFGMVLAAAYATAAGGLAAGMVASREGVQFDGRRRGPTAAGVLLLAAAVVLALVAASMTETT